MSMKKLFLIVFLTISSLLQSQVSSEYVNTLDKSNSSNKTQQVMAAPVNDDCSSATVLTIGAALTCNQTTDQATLQTGECYTNYGGGSTETSVWYRFTASNDSLVLNILRTNTSNCAAPHVAVYGPFASGSGCLPCGSYRYDVLQSGDPGSHILLTGLATSGNRDYLVQVQANECGGGNDRFVNFCINITNPAINSSVTVPSIINQCGVTFNGTTNGGYWATGSSLGFNNLDGNNGTTVTGASETGDDVTFVVNNISWFKFCTSTAGTYNVQFDVISCAFTGLNSGGQMAILTGTNNNLTNIWQAANPTYTGTAVQTSPNFALAANGCAYLVVDGFAGDACSYSYVLTNVTGGCNILPIELLYFNGNQISCNENQLSWSTATELNNNYFEIQRSDDAINFTTIGKVNGAGTSTSIHKYQFKDSNPNKDINYYRLKQVDYNGNSESFSITSIDNSCSKNIKVSKITNLLGQEVNDNYRGVKIYYYSDGTYTKKVETSN